MLFFTLYLYINICTAYFVFFGTFPFKALTVWSLSGHISSVLPILKNHFIPVGDTLNEIIKTLTPCVFTVQLLLLWELHNCPKR